MSSITGSDASGDGQIDNPDNWSTGHVPESSGEVTFGGVANEDCNDLLGDSLS